MNVSSRFVEPLTQEDICSLQTLWKESDNHRRRTRALAILLSHRNYSINQIADICEVQRDTVRRWIDAWEEDHLQGLEDARRCGAPRRFEPSEEAQILEYLGEYPNQPKTVQAIVQEETGKILTDDILYRLAHQHGYT